jgi:hypothetical protein
MKKQKISFAFNISIILLLLMFHSISPAQISFIQHTIDGNFPGANSVYALDVDGDSLIDVLGAGLSANSITLWKNNGSNPILWQEQTIDNGFHAASSVFSIDLDGDQDNDILGSAWMDNDVAWWRNDSGNPIQWTKQLIDESFAGAEEVYALDIDNDNDVDVLGAAMIGNQIALWYNNGESSIAWTKRIIDGNFNWARSVYTFDVNGDSLLDILGAAYTANSIAVWYNNGDSTWTKQIVDSTFLGAHKVFACDLDNDNDPDIIGAAHIGDQIAWWRNDGSNPIQWTKKLIVDDFDGAISVYACDIDGDDDVDVIGTAEVAGDIALWINNGGSPINWEKQTLSSNFAGTWGVYAEDIDSDGDIDVLGAASYANDITWWENEGIMSLKDHSNSPDNLQLLQNFPNPFNPITTIKYDVLERSLVSIKIFNVLGNEVAEIVNGEKLAGTYEVKFNAENLISGVYFYRLKSGSFVDSKKMLLMK